MTHTKPEAAVTDVDALAQEIRRVNGSNNLGAGAMAEALMPFVQALRSNNTAGVKAEPVAWLKTWTTGSDHCKRVDLGPHVEPWLAECSPTITPLYASPTPIVEPVAPEAVADWVLVPRNPTRNMLWSGHEVVSTSLTAERPFGHMRKAWEAMLAAAPSSPTPIVEPVAPEAVDADDETEMTWRDLALQFDGHRIEALSMLRYAVRHIEEYATVQDILREPLGELRLFLSKPPLPGERVLAERIAALATPPSPKPAPASEVVTDEFPKPRRNDGGQPCGECHLKPGETCDICGARAALTMEKRT